MSYVAEPFGYKLHNGHLIPVDRELLALNKAIWYLENGCSIRSTRDWLVNHTGRKISHQGMLKAIDSQRKKITAFNVRSGAGENGTGSVSQSDRTEAPESSQEGSCRSEVERENHSGSQIN